jgi:hypothetical protein
MDRWRPETHTFHFPFGEMTITLEDVALLLGLPCAGKAMGAVDIPVTWRDEILARFMPVVRNARAVEPYEPFTNVHGPTSKWLQQFSVCTKISLFIKFL